MGVGAVVVVMAQLPEALDLLILAVGVAGRLAALREDPTKLEEMGVLVL
jgi:hypothetical protein